MADIFIFGDLHLPFHYRPALTKAMERLSEKKFDYVVQIGDLLDQYNFTRFTKKYIITPDREIKSGRYFAEKFWSDVRKLQPQAKLIQILGNHDVRMLRRSEEKIPEVQDLIKASLLELYRFDNVKTIEDPREEFFIKDIAFLHGYKSKNGDHMKWMHSNAVHGHRHRGEVTYIPIRGRTLWELDVGYLADPNQVPLAYSEQKTTNWTWGHGEIDHMGPRFVAYNFKKG